MGGLSNIGLDETPKQCQTFQHAALASLAACSFFIDETNTTFLKEEQESL